MPGEVVATGFSGWLLLSAAGGARLTSVAVRRGMRVAVGLGVYVAGVVGVAEGTNVPPGPLTITFWPM